MINYGTPQRLRRHGTLTRNYFVRVYETESGRRTWVTTGCKTLKNAREWIATQRMYAAMGSDRADAQKASEMTFSEAHEIWMEEKRGKVSEERFSLLKILGNAFWIRVFGKRRLRDITTEEIQKYSRKRKAGLLGKGRRKGKAISPRTVNEDLRNLSSIFNYCLRKGWVHRSPMIGVEKWSGEPRRRVRMITAEEEARLLAACREATIIDVSAKRNVGGPRGGKSSKEPSQFRQTVPVPDYLYPLVLTALNCGFRRRTLLSVRWRDIDLEKKEWRIPAEFLKVPEDYHAPVPDLVTRELREYRQRIVEECRKRSVSPVDRLAPGSRIFGLTPQSSIHRSFERAVQRSGLVGLTFHDLRRIYVNKLRQLGVSLETAMRLSAHRSVQTVLKYYREVQPEELREAVRVLDRRAE